MARLGLRALLAPALILVPFAAVAETIEDSAAYARFQADFAQTCFWVEAPPSAQYYPPESWPLTWKTDYSDTPHTATLYKFFCGSGAYNVSHVYYIERDGGDPLPVAFASPAFDVAYEDDDFDGVAGAVTINGITTRYLMINSEFDPESQTITEHGLWRGIGDAASGGLWALAEGEFILKFFDIDASYDGEINPERVITFE